MGRYEVSFLAPLRPRLTRALYQRPAGGDEDAFVEFKRQLLWENEKQFAAFRGELNELKGEVQRLKLALQSKEGPKGEAEKGTLLA